MNSFASKITAIVGSIVLLAYIGYQVFTSLYNPYQSEIVKQGTYTQDIDLNGFFVRDEKALPQTKQGVISYRYQNAEKIPKNAVVANIYERESDLYNIEKIEKLKNQKKLLTQAEDKQSAESSKLDTLNTQVNAIQTELIRQVDEGDLSNLDKTYDSLLLNMNKIAVCVDNTVNYETTIADLDSEIASLQSKISNESKAVRSENSGYFSSTADGYEEIFTLSMLKDLSVNKVEKIIKEQALSSVENIGKVQSDASWYFVSLVKSEDIESFKKDTEITLKFNSKSYKEIKVKVSDVITQKDSENSVVVLTSDYLDEDFISMRFEKPRAVINSHNGIIIPKEAIRFGKVMQTVVDEKTKEKSQVEKEVKGVYILLGKSVRFKQLDIVYEDNYVVVSKPNISSDYVNIYDRVVIKGKDLYGSS